MRHGLKAAPDLIFRGKIAEAEPHRPFGKVPRVRCAAGRAVEARTAEHGELFVELECEFGRAHPPMLKETTAVRCRASRGP